MPRMQRSAISSFMRVGVLWRCAADPGSISAIVSGPGSAVHRVRDMIAKSAPPGRGEPGGALMSGGDDAGPDMRRAV
jgi:hypothetical protein